MRSIDQGVGAGKLNPVALGDVAFGDRYQAGYARFGRKEIIVVGIWSSCRDIVSDAQQPALRMVQETKLHGLEVDLCLRA